MDEAVHSGIAFFIPLIIIVTLLLIPIARILRRTGHSRWWCLIAWIPIVNIIALWVLAFVPWPTVDKN